MILQIETAKLLWCQFHRSSDVWTSDRGHWPSRPSWKRVQLCWISAQIKEQIGTII